MTFFSPHCLCISYTSSFGELASCLLPPCYDTMIFHLFSFSLEVSHHLLLCFCLREMYLLNNWSCSQFLCIVPIISWCRMHFLFFPPNARYMLSLMKVHEDSSCKDLTAVYSATHLLMCNGPVHILLYLMLTDGCHVDQCPSRGHQALPSRSPTQTCQPIRRAQRVAHHTVQHTDGI